MELVKFKEVNLEDPFFDSLKADYKGFEEWFGRKSDNDAYIQKKNHYCPLKIANSSLK